MRISDHLATLTARTVLFAIAVVLAATLMLPVAAGVLTAGQAYGAPFADDVVEAAGATWDEPDPHVFVDPLRTTRLDRSNLPITYEHIRYIPAG